VDRSTEWEISGVMAEKALNFLQGLTGCFGFPVAENPTQAMIEPAYRAMGLDWRYLTLEVRPENLGDAVRGARAMGFKGFNCTIPHKVEVIQFLDELTPAAQKIGAVNCVAIKNGRLLGENTDGKGFLQSVRDLRPIEGVNVVLLGAGGAARAIAVELALAGARKITIVNRSVERGLTLEKRLQEQTSTETAFVPWTGTFVPDRSVDLLVNSTSIGLYPDVDAVVPVSLDELSGEAIVCDVIPNPPRTRLVADAQARGLQVLDGLGMLVNQGVIGIELWTDGQSPDPAVMRSSLETIFGV
jgi:shikimate dehydrogenase